MAKGKKKWWYILGFFVFVIYVFAAARPVRRETILKPRWITSLESNNPIVMGDAPADSGESLLPFTVGDFYGYLRDNGQFALNQTKKGYISLSENNWAEYEALPSSIRIMNPQNENVLTIDNPRGYPLFLDDSIFIVGSEQNSLTALGGGGEELWTYDFPAPITCIDAAGAYVLAGTLDGAVEFLDASGVPVFTPFEPGGSRLSVILGCAVSRDASRMAVISGIDNQRFLLLERSGDTSKVIYHEFLKAGFRRPVHVSFADNDTKVVFEKEGGLGIYDINSRTSTGISLEGEITAIDNSGVGGFLFVITSQGAKQKRFVAIRYPGNIAIEAPFKSDNAFFARRDKKLFLGGDLTVASFELEKK